MTKDIFDLDLDFYIFKLDLDMIKMYPSTENQVDSFSRLKVIA